MQAYRDNCADWKKLWVDEPIAVHELTVRELCAVYVWHLALYMQIVDVL
jgi:hypothetical protein